jgi:hypothetical protein
VKLSSLRKGIVLFTFIAVILLLFFYPLFGRISYDVQLTPPDIYYMLPKSFWLYLTLIQVFLVVQQLFSRGKAEITLTGLFLTAILPWLLYGALPISQFPSIYTVNDAVYHLANARKVVIDGGLLTPANDYLQYPGTSFLTAFLSNTMGITGDTPLLAFGIVLNIMFVLLIAFILLRIGERILGPETGFLLPIIYFVGNTTFFTQFCPQNFALALYFLSILIFIYPSKQTGSSKHMLFMLMLVSSTLIMTHPITNLFQISTLFGLYIIQKTSKKQIGLRLSLHFFVFETVVTFLWWVFFAAENFSIASNGLFTLLTKSPLLEPRFLSILQYPSFLSQVLRIFSWSFYGFAGMAALCGIAVALFRRQERIKVFIGIFSGILSIGIFPFLLFEGEWADRTLLFVFFPVSGLAVHGLNNLFSLGSKRRFAIYCRKILVCTFVALIPLAFMYHHQYDSIEYVNAWDFSVTKFLVEFSPSKSIALPWSPGMRAEYSYHNPNILDLETFTRWTWDPEIRVFSVKVARLYEYTQENSTAYVNEMLSYASSIPFNRLYDNGFTMAYTVTNLTRTR